MPYNILMPQLGLTMTEGSVSSWLKKPGELVKKGEMLFTVETDKVEMEVESEVEGTVTRLTAEEGDTIAVGGELGYVDSAEDEGLGDLSDLLG